MPRGITEQPKAAFQECATVTVMLRKKYPEISIDYGNIWCESPLTTQQESYRAVFYFKQGESKVYFDVNKSKGRYFIQDQFEIDGSFFETLPEAIETRKNGSTIGEFQEMTV